MNYRTWALINGPLFTLNFTPNAFYLFCMVRPLQGERIKQPLKLLLGSLIVSTIAYLTSVFAVFFSVPLAESNNMTHVARLVSVCCLSTSISSSVWLNFFYCTQIVPAHRALFIWIKKNIKAIIFCIWFVEIVYSVLDFTVVLVKIFPLEDFGFNDTFTMDQTNQTPAWVFVKHLNDMYLSLIFLQRFHFYFCVGVMVVSSGVTVAYLCRHMRRIVANGQSLSCPRLSSQVRVTVTGILQGLLFVTCAVWREYRFVSEHTDSAFTSPYIHLTVINLYMSGTTFNLGVGQAVFRHRAADIWTRAAQLCRAPTEQQPQQGV